MVVAVGGAGVRTCADLCCCGVVCGSGTGHAQQVSSHCGAYACVRRGALFVFVLCFVRDCACGVGGAGGVVLCADMLCVGDVVYVCGVACV